MAQRSMHAMARRRRPSNRRCGYRHESNERVASSRGNSVAYGGRLFLLAAGFRLILGDADYHTDAGCVFMMGGYWA